MRWILKTLVLLALCTAVFGGGGWFAYQLYIKPNQIPKEDLVGGKPAPPPDPSLLEFEKAMKLKSARQPVEVREALERFLENYPCSTKIADARKALGMVNTDVFFSAIPAPDKIRYEVRSGDSVEKIRRKLNTTDEMLMRCNNLDDPRRLRVGQVLLVSQTDFSVVIDRKAHMVTLLNHGKFFKEYPAASWNAPAAKKGMEKISIPAKVGQKTAWHNGTQVVFGSKEYSGSARWVDLTVKGYTLYTEGGQKPPSGIGMSPEDMDEISTLIGKGIPVTIH